MKPDPKTGEVAEGNTKEFSGPEPEAPKPEVQVSSGSEPGKSERPLPKRPRKTRIEGSKRLSCKRCDHFLGEMKADGNWEFLTNCHRCKTENRFAFEMLK